MRGVRWDFACQIHSHVRARAKDPIHWYDNSIRTYSDMAGGLDERVDEALLQTTFMTFGDIKEVKIPPDPVTSAYLTTFCTHIHYL